MKNILLLTIFFAGFALQGKSQRLEISYDFGISDVVFESKSGFTYSLEYENSARFGNSVQIMKEWPTHVNGVTLLSGLTFARHQIKQVTHGHIDYGFFGYTDTYSIRSEIAINSLGVPVLLRYKEDWKKLELFISGGPVFRVIYKVKSDDVDLRNGEPDIYSARLRNAGNKALDMTIYANLGVQKELTEKIKLLVFLSANLDIFNGDNESPYVEDGSIIYRALGVGVSYGL